MDVSAPVDLWLLHEPADTAAFAASAALHAALGAEGLHVGLGAPGGMPRALLLLHRGAVAQALPRLRALREAWPDAVLLLRCPAPREVDEVLALEMGADAVLAEACGGLLVAARLRALLRRQERRQERGWRHDPPLPAADAAGAAGGHGASRRLAFGRLSIDREARRVALAGREVALTEGEFEVLWLLASHCGEPLSRRELLARLRGGDVPAGDAAASEGTPEADPGRSIDSRVYRLRGKLGGGGAHGGIRTVRHRGYLFTPSAW